MSGDTRFVDATGFTFSTEFDDSIVSVKRAEQSQAWWVMLHQVLPDGSVNRAIAKNVSREELVRLHDFLAETIAAHSGEGEA